MGFRCIWCLNQAAAKTRRWLANTVTTIHARVVGGRGPDSEAPCMHNNKYTVNFYTIAITNSQGSPGVQGSSQVEPTVPSTGPEGSVQGHHTGWRRRGAQGWSGEEEPYLNQNTPTLPGR